MHNISGLYTAYEGRFSPGNRTIIPDRYSSGHLHVRDQGHTKHFQNNKRKNTVRKDIIGVKYGKIRAFKK